MNDYKVVKFKNDRININVRLDGFNNTIWQTQSEIVLIFDTTKNNIIMHIKNIIEKYRGGK